MLVSKHIPTKILEQGVTKKFVGVLDNLVLYKRERMAKGLRVHNPAICLDKSWLIKSLEEYGINKFPLDIPLEILVQVSLNIDTLLRLRGCKRGLEMYCSVLSLGEVIIDDSAFFSESFSLRLNSFTHGMVVDNATDIKLYLTSKSGELEPTKEISINIKSRYFNGSYPKEATAIKSYLEKNIPNYLGFSPKKEIHLTYGTATDFKYDSLLNNYFI